MRIINRPPTAKGPAATFTGDVWVEGVYDGGLEMARLAVVRFAPCARSHWHSHRCTSSRAPPCSARATAPSSKAHPGETIYTAPGEEHWHGAAPGYFMAHLVLMEGDGEATPLTDWAEAVTDTQYRAPRTATD